MASSTLYYGVADAEKLALYVTPPLSPEADRDPLLGTALGISKFGPLIGMEGEDSQRQQYGQHNYQRELLPNSRGQNPATVPGGTVYNIQDMRRRQRADATERFGQAQMLGQHTPTSGSISATGGSPQHMAGYAFLQGQQYQMQGNPIQFHQDYPQDPQRQQQFPNYTSQMAHNVPQHAQPQSPYDTMPQYQPRQSAAIEVLPTQFGVPPFYNPGDATSASGPTSLSQQYASANFPQQVPYQSGTVDRSVMSNPYQQTMAEYSQAQAQPSEDQPEQEEIQDIDDYERYQGDLRQINQDISEGKLNEAGPRLLELSRWLLGHVGQLGLITDRREVYGDVYEERLKLWNEFNLCWEGLLQRQKDSTQRMIDSGQPPSSSQSLLDKSFLSRMGDELIRLCDGVEQHGLVDYEMGVAEELIISTLTQCLDLLEGTDGTPEAEATPTAAPSAQG